ncbi:PTS sugar transporter subunit IIA [Nocardioides sp. cx-173]|uniref:PTS sugar transporter subunit IIA n=1 Tax=Nocardioides sp. cx-173 TaxID=2898796 RepID=UPI001E372FF3|nr:PTS sugar transporter subunit IIA [Nocardioides sp. cx-173]MCD4524886.1 PTS sugar transporter subunit IIA [Nocardioides sp. cx-173]UGB43389.1 PTS sugar transporter subunit IIA [Nocardioides sp. cx-173]
MTALITPDLVRLDADLGADKDAVIHALADVVAQAGRATDLEALVADVLAREAKAATCLTGGIAIPHCRTAGVEVPTLVFARLSPKVDFGAEDGPADLAFLIAAPAGGDDAHLQILTRLARALVRPEFPRELRGVQTADQAIAILGRAVATL